MQDQIKKTGFNQVKWRPIGNQIALLLSDDDLKILGSKNAKKEKKSTIIQPKKKSIIQNAKGMPKLDKGAALEAEEAESRKNNRTFTVAAISLSLVDKEDSVEVGDEVSLLAGTMTEIIVDDVVYGIVPGHRILGIHESKIAPSLD